MKKLQLGHSQVDFEILQRLKGEISITVDLISHLDYVKRIMEPANSSLKAETYN